MPEAVVVAVARSPITRAGKGALAGVRADDLTAQVVRAALDQVPELDPTSVDDLLLGCGMPGGEQGFNMARVVAVLLGLDGVPGATTTRYCASSLQTTRAAMHAIRAGEADVVVSAGVEVVSRFRAGSSDAPPADAPSATASTANPWTNPAFDEARDRSHAKAGGGADVWRDPREDGSVPDVYVAMGQTAEDVARRWGVTREAQDAYALRSQQRTRAATGSGFWARDTTPVTLPDGTVVDADESPRPGTTAEALAGLEPVFRPDGTVTAGNCCPLNDGAAALVVMSDARARDLGVTPLARVVSTGVSGISPEVMGLGPVEASRRALALAGMTVGDMDLVELNEAFAAQVLPAAEQLGVADDRLNVHGGAIAVGHPFGMTGARMTSTLLHGLQATDGSLGLETMCVGGGQGMAMVLERLS